VSWRSGLCVVCPHPCPHGNARRLDILEGCAPRERACSGVSPACCSVDEVSVVEFAAVREQAGVGAAVTERERWPIRRRIRAEILTRRTQRLARLWVGRGRRDPL
jgi:hypothetical protein